LTRTTEDPGVRLGSGTRKRVKFFRLFCQWPKSIVLQFGRKLLAARNEADQLLQKSELMEIRIAGTDLPNAVLAHEKLSYAHE
jgi:hypothetical protein